MKRLLLCMSLLLCHCVLAFSQHYKWIRGGGSSTAMFASMEDERVTYMCHDDNNNIYVVSPVGDLDITADTFYMASSFNHGGGSYPHALLASYDCNGNIRWAKLFDAYYTSYIYGVTYMNGSIYITGALLGKNKHIGYDTTITSHNLSSYVARLDTLGHLKWIRFVGPDSTNTFLETGGPAALQIDGQDFIHAYMLIGNNVTINSSVVSTMGTYDLKYDSTGSLLSVKRMEIDTNGRITGMAINNKSGNVYATLYTLDPVSSASIHWRIAGFDTSDMLMWADTTLTFSCGFGNLAYDQNGSIYSVAVGNTVPFILEKDTVKDIYGGYNISVVFKTDTNGRIKWTFPLSSDGFVNNFIAVALLPNGDVACSGVLGGKTRHDDDSINAPSGQQPSFVIVDSSGNLVKLDWLSGSGFYNASGCIMSDNAGSVYIGGSTESTISTQDGTESYTSVGGNTDFFVAKYGYNCNCTGLTAPADYFTYTGGAGVPETVHFTYLGSAAADSIRWEFGDGSSSTSMNPSHTYDTAGVYHACLTIYTSCDSSTYCKDIFATLGVESVTGTIDVKVYPNPMRDELIIEGADKGMEVSIFNMVGQRVYSETVTMPRQIINMRDLGAGTYLLQLTAENGSRYSKTIVKVE